MPSSRSIIRARYAIQMHNPTILKSVRFQDLPKDVDAKANLGHQNRKERRLRRKQKKMEEKHHLEKTVESNLEFLRYVADLDRVADSDAAKEVAAGAAPGIFADIDSHAEVEEEVSAEEAKAAVFRKTRKTDAIRETDLGKIVIKYAKEKDYLSGDVEGRNVAKLLVENSEKWRDDKLFVHHVEGWRLESEEKRLVINMSTSTISSSESDQNQNDFHPDFTLERVENDVVRKLRDIIDTCFRAHGHPNVYETLRGFYEGDNFDSLTAFFKEEIHFILENDSPVQDHSRILKEALTWFTDQDVTPSDRRDVFKAVFAGISAFSSTAEGNSGGAGPGQVVPDALS